MESIQRSFGFSCRWSGSFTAAYRLRITQLIFHSIIFAVCPGISSWQGPWAGTLMQTHDFLAVLFSLKNSLRHHTQSDLWNTDQGSAPTKDPPTINKDRAIVLGQDFQCLTLKFPIETASSSTASLGQTIYHTLATFPPEDISSLGCRRQSFPL